MRKTLVAMVLICLSTGATAAHHDGNWWVSKTPEFKAAYVTGLSDSGGTGAELVTLSCFAMKSKAKADECVDTVLKGYYLEELTYLDNQKPSTIAAAMDSYYVDTENRKISASTVFWWVVRAAKGHAPSAATIAKERKYAD